VARCRDRGRLHERAGVAGIEVEGAADGRSGRGVVGRVLLLARGLQVGAGESGITRGGRRERELAAQRGDALGGGGAGSGDRDR
jgi:hypothetical protein